MHSRDMSASCHGKQDVSLLAGPYLHTGIGFTILCKVCGGKMLMAEELQRKAKQVELHNSQQDDQHVPTKKVLELVKVLSVLHTRYGGVWFFSLREFGIY